MQKRSLVFAVMCLLGSSVIANDCDTCNKAVEAKFLVCFKKAKNEAEKKECESSRDKERKVCQIVKCSKGLF